MIRLKERVDKNSAAVAKALVDMVISEVADARENKDGLTAEQVILKIEHDYSCAPILPHLLRDMSEDERERLLTDILPKRHLIHAEDDPTSYPIELLEKCFRMTFNLLSPEKKTLVARRFVSILRQQPEQEVSDYQLAFFRAGDLRYMDEGERAMVRSHLLSQLRVLTHAKLDVMEGLGEFLTGFDFTRYINAVFRTATQERNEGLRSKATVLLGEEHLVLDEKRQKVLVGQMELAKKGYEDQGKRNWAEGQSP